MFPRVTSLRCLNSFIQHQVWRGSGATVHRIQDQVTRNLHISSCLRVEVTLPLRAEPMKRKARLDPAIEKTRKERMVKRLEKVQHKMGKPDLKPVEEFMYDPRIFTDDRIRPDPELSFEEEERRALLQREWNAYKQSEHAEETRIIDVAMRSQQRALEELRAESEELYQKALETDFSLFPLDITGPTRTPPIKGYKEQLSMDGEYVNKTKVFK